VHQAHQQVRPGGPQHPQTAVWHSTWTRLWQQQPASVQLWWRHWTAPDDQPPTAAGAAAAPAATKSSTRLLGQHNDRRGDFTNPHLQKKLISVRCPGAPGNPQERPPVLVTCTNIREKSALTTAPAVWLQSPAGPQVPPCSRTPGLLLPQPAVAAGGAAASGHPPGPTAP